MNSKTAFDSILNIFQFRWLMEASPVTKIYCRGSVNAQDGKTRTLQVLELSVEGVFAEPFRYLCECMGSLVAPQMAPKVHGLKEDTRGGRLIGGGAKKGFKAGSWQPTSR